MEYSLTVRSDKDGFDDLEYVMKALDMKIAIDKILTLAETNDYGEAMLVKDFRLHVDDILKRLDLKHLF